MHKVTDTPQSMEEVLHPGADASHVQPGFPAAPKGWSPSQAEEIANMEGLTLGEDQWAAIRMLQDYYARNELDRINARELHDALEETFHSRGGLRFVYQIFPRGPIAQGCRLAGLKPPPGATDPGFGHAV